MNCHRNLKFKPDAASVTNPAYSNAPILRQDVERLEAYQNELSRNHGQFNTEPEAVAKSRELGYHPTSQRTRTGARFYKNYNKKNDYISRDIPSRTTEKTHNGGAWKRAKSPDALNSKTIRPRTFNRNLEIRLGD
ncbi:MAG: toxin C-terminal domain-containing protein [Rhodobacterales bacterium]|nr:toxin C-terminal domain-containing protein [Rhodobacterales bacterium]